jgi:predicted metal-dependent HD superfamily phosphohydrolase
MMENFPALQVTEEQLSFLSAEWNMLSGRFGAGLEAIDRVWGSVVRKYSVGDRFYHNLGHIAEMLRLIKSHQEQIQDYESVCFAVWFHDVIYDTRRRDNEERSAEFAGEAMQHLHAPPEVIRRTKDLILATKRHQADGLNSDAEVFLDADLSILGKPERVYLEYSKAIRREYAWVPESIYREKRKEVLQGFLTRERIYFNDDMRARFEAPARQNLARELLSMSS